MGAPGGGAGAGPAGPPPAPSRPAPPPPDETATDRRVAEAGAHADDRATAEADAAELERLRRELAATPAEVIVANHLFGLFELAALHLSDRPPDLGAARLAIDAMAAVVEQLGGRLGEAERALVDALAQIRLAYVQIAAAHQQAGTGAAGTGPPTGTPGDGPA